MGFRAIKGIREQDMLDLIAGRVILYKTVESLEDVNLSKETLMRLANADTFGSLGLNRREALWQVAALDDRPIGLFTGQPSDSAFEEPAYLPTMSESENVVHDYASTTLSLRGHPVQYIRSNLSAWVVFLPRTKRPKKWSTYPNGRCPFCPAKTRHGEGSLFYFY